MNVLIWLLIAALVLVIAWAVWVTRRDAREDREFLHQLRIKRRWNP